MRFFFKTLTHILFLILLGLIGMAGYTKFPDAYKPWSPINLNDDINFLTSYKISQLQADYTRCRNVLNDTDISFTPLPDRNAGECRLENQINLEQSLYPYSAPVKGQCALIAALILWEKQVLSKAAQKYFDSDIKRINHYGMFSCRNVRGSSRRSQHAVANAIDIAGFTFQNGKTVSVQNHWDKETIEGLFLQDIHNGACRIFSTVLGPDYNRLHADHFHLDLGPYSICR